MPPSMTVEVLDFGDVFPFFLDGVGINIHYKRVMTTNLALASSAPKTFLVFLVFIIRLA